MLATSQACSMHSNRSTGSRAEGSLSAGAGPTPLTRGSPAHRRTALPCASPLLIPVRQQPVALHPKKK